MLHEPLEGAHMLLLAQALVPAGCGGEQNQQPGGQQQKDAHHQEGE